MKTGICALETHQRRVSVVDITDGDRVIEEIIDIRKPWSGLVLIDTVVKNPKQPRKFFEEEALNLLAGSIKSTMQVSPITVVLYETSDDPKILWMINNGERRLRALKINGQVYIWVAYNPLITTKNLFQTSAIANLCEQKHTYMENANAIKEMMALCNTDDYRVIADQTAFTEVWTGQLYSLTKLHPSLQILLDPPTPKSKRIPIDAAFALARVDQEKQLEVWSEVKDSSKSHMSVLVRSLTGAAKSIIGTRKHAPSDDARIAAGKFKSIKSKIERAIELPDCIFDKIPEERKPALKAMVQSMHELLQKLEARLGSVPAGAMPNIVEDEDDENEVADNDVSADESVGANTNTVSTSIDDKINRQESKPKSTSRVKVRETTKSTRSIFSDQPAPPAPYELRHPTTNTPASGTPADDLPRALPKEDPQAFLQAMRKRVEEERRKALAKKSLPQEFTPVYQGGNGNSTVSRVGVKKALTAEEIVRNIQKERQSASERMKPHQKYNLTHRPPVRKIEGKGFTDADFANGDDFAHGAGG